MITSYQENLMILNRLIHEQYILNLKGEEERFASKFKKVRGVNLMAKSK